jgi:hypothetical protein
MLTLVEVLPPQLLPDVQAVLRWPPLGTAVSSEEGG